MKHANLLALALCLSLAAACKKNEKKVENSPAPNPTSPRNAPDAAASKPDAAALPTMFTAEGLATIKIGSQVDEQELQEALPGTEVTEEVETVEGEPAGKMYKVKKDGQLLFIARPDDSGKLQSLEFHSGFKGPKDIEPGVTKYEEARESIGVKNCVGGAEDFAEEIRCETNEPGIRIAFADPEAKHMATPIPAKKQDQVLADRIVRWTTLTGPTDR